MSISDIFEVSTPVYSLETVWQAQRQIMRVKFLSQVLRYADFYSEPG